MLCYCGNVHGGEDLADVLASLARGPGRVREFLGARTLDYGLWLSRRALSELRSAGTALLQERLEGCGLRVHTCNAFPFGNFHAEVVKRDVYQPDWTQPLRLDYTLEVAEVLAQLLPVGQERGTISSLPLGHRASLAEEQLAAAAENLLSAAQALAEIEGRTGKRIELLLEPEPGCWLETSSDVVAFWNQTLRPAAQSENDRAVLERYLGVCWDTCHHAVVFQSPAEVMRDYRDNQIFVGKVQLSCAIELDPREKGALATLMTFDEGRFLHQTRARIGARVEGVDDLEDCDRLPKDAALWRVHFHVPIHRELPPPLRRTHADLVAAISLNKELEREPHWEVETYTWGVLPGEARPANDSDLAAGLAGELRYAQEQLT